MSTKDFNAYFISDIHLGHENDPNLFLLVEFLRQLKKSSNVTHLFLVGDIFDLWIGSHQYFAKKFTALIDELRWLKDSGVRIIYFEGNHDLYLQKFWQENLGFEVFREPQYFSLGDARVRVEHGDLYDPQDYGYRFLKSVLNTPLVKWVGENFSESFVVRLGESSSRKSRHYTSEVKIKSADEIKSKLREYAKLKYNEDSFQWMITGHTHVADEFTLESGARSVNLGVWGSTPRAFHLTPNGGAFVDIKKI